MEKQNLKEVLGIEDIVEITGYGKSKSYEIIREIKRMFPACGLGRGKIFREQWVKWKRHCCQIGG